jgi:hypothetical protein
MSPVAEDETAGFDNVAIDEAVIDDAAEVGTLDTVLLAGPDERKLLQRTPTLLEAGVLKLGHGIRDDETAGEEVKEIIDDAKLDGVGIIDDTVLIWKLTKYDKHEMIGIMLDEVVVVTNPNENVDVPMLGVATTDEEDEIVGTMLDQVAVVGLTTKDEDTPMPEDATADDEDTLKELWEDDCTPLVVLDSRKR